MMQFATTFQLGSIPSGFCSDINATTDNINIGSGNTFSGFWPYLSSIPGSYETTGNVIARAVFEKLPINNAPALPAELETQKIYFLRKTGSDVKVYLTFADAQGESNRINFATSANGYLFSVYFIDIVYRHLNAWSPAAPTLAEIPCCPDVPAVFTNCPNIGSVSYMGETRELARFNTYGQNFNADGSLNSHEPIQKTFTSANGHVYDVEVYINFYFNDLPLPSGNVQGHPGLVIFFSGSYGPNFGEQIFGQFYYTTSNNFETNMTLNLIDPQPDFLVINNLNQLTDQGFLPSTINLSFSGSITPPSQIKVSIPDAFFKNNFYDNATVSIIEKPINLGLIEDVLTYDHSTRTYWGSLQNIAGITGRIHLSIPSFYPLTSSGVNFINCGSGYRAQNNFRGGEFLDIHLNDSSNSEFNFYQTFYAEIDLGVNLWAINKLRLFSSCDSFGGYPTGLSLGESWFDSRILYNVPLGFNFDFLQNDLQKNKILSIAFSRWGESKFRLTNEIIQENDNSVNHYHQNIFYIKSVHPDAYITSLGL
jgi:hypothetical protein